MAVAGLLMSGVSCEKEITPTEHSDMFVTVGESSLFEGVVSTKASLVDNLNQFKERFGNNGIGVYARIYDRGSYSSKFDNLNVTWNNGEWRMARAYKWSFGSDSKPISTDFYGFAPYVATGMQNIGFADAAKTVRFDYSLNDNDILVGFYSGYGGEQNIEIPLRVAEMTFYHALTAVKFISGNVDPLTIHTITFNNVPTSATCNAAFNTTTPSFSWSNYGNFDNITKSFNKHITRANQEITGNGDVYLFLPQTFAASSKASVVVNATLSGADAPRDFTSPLKNKRWEAGKCYTYKVDIVGTELRFTLVDWEYIEETVVYSRVVQVHKMLDFYKNDSHSPERPSNYKIVMDRLSDKVKGKFWLNSPEGAEFVVSLIGDFDAFDVVPDPAGERRIHSDSSAGFVITPKPGIVRDRDYEVKVRVGLVLSDGTGINIDDDIQGKQEDQRYSIVLRKEI